MSAYAKGTLVPVDRSKAELEKILSNYGADQFSSGWTNEKVVVMFRANNRYIRIDMPIPILEKNTSSCNQIKGKFYSIEKLDAEKRRKWRAMILYVKAKLESVNSGIVSFEQAFMAHIVLPNRQTVSEFMAPQIESAYGNGDMPKQLPGY